MKICASCLDGVEYPKDQGECPKCGNFLKFNQDSLSTKNEDDEFASVFFNDAKLKIQGNSPENLQHLDHEPSKGRNQSTMQHLKRKTIKTNKESIQGQVDHFQEEHVPAGFLSKWFESLFSGVPYIKDGYVNSFQIYDQENEGHEVILYGKILRGKIGNNQIVHVHGKRDRHGTIIAQTIENVNSKTTVSVKSGLSSGTVRFLTLLFLILTAFIVYTVYSIDWTSLIHFLIDSTINFVMGIIGAILPFIIFILIIWFVLKRFFR